MAIGLKGNWKESEGMSLRGRLDRLRWDLRCAAKRAYKGYDSRDVFALYDMFREKYLCLLKEYKETHIGLFNVPKEIESDIDKFYGCDMLHFNEEQTDAILDMMIYHLEMMDEDYVEKLLYGKNIFDNDYDYKKDFSIEKSKHIWSIIDQNKDLFFELFRIFFWELWD